MLRSPTISIVIPAFNEEKLLAETLTSLLNQKTKLAYEIIVVNNNSTDNTEKVARKFAVKVVRETKQGVVFARQKGLMEARGELVAGADSDCLYSLDWLDTIYRHFLKDPSVVAVGGPGKGREKTPLWGYITYNLGFKFIDLIYRLTGKVFYLLASNFAYRRETFLRLGGYRTYLPLGAGDEWDALWRLQTVGKAIFEPRAETRVSLRRYRVGFVKFWLIHCLYYYILGGILANIFKQPVVQAKAVRE